MAETITLSIKRFYAPQNKTWWQDYDIDLKSGMTVLEALYFIAENIDGSLSFRYSCRGAVCGSCAMMINGTITLACHTQIASLLPGTVKIEPLPRFKVLKDLIVEMDAFLEKYRSSRSRESPRSTSRRLYSPLLARATASLEISVPRIWM